MTFSVGSSIKAALAWGRLLRLSLATTAAADVVGGAVYAGQGWPGMGRLWLPIAASLCVYHGGMVLNDCADAEPDLKTRPERPIPSGAVNPQAALTVAIVLLALGPLLALNGGPRFDRPPAVVVRHGDDGQRSLHSDRLGPRFFCESKKLSHHCGYKREIMNRNPIPSRQTPVTSLQVGHGLACLTLLLSLYAGSIGQTRSEAQSPVPGSAIHVTHVLGFEGARHNATGNLKIQGDAVQFQRDGSPTARVNISSIQGIVLICPRIGYPIFM